MMLIIARKIGVLVGSLRKESFSKKLLKTLKKITPDSIELENVEIGNLALYNQDYDDEGVNKKQV